MAISLKTTGKPVHKAKIIDHGLASPDDPIFSGGALISLTPNQSSLTTTSRPASDGELGPMPENWERKEELTPEEQAQWERIQDEMFEGFPTGAESKESAS